MADTSPASETPPPSTESKTQREARLRRERRNAKLQAGGSERLSKITSLSGRPAAAEAELARTPPQRTASPAVQQNENRKPDAHTEDPAEVDISNMFQRPPQAEGAEDPTEMMRRMMRATSGDGAGQDPGAGGGQDDPMRMLQQMLSGGADGQAGGGLPPGFANMFGGGQEEEASRAGSGDYLWRVVHALFSFLLGIYAVSSLSFTGSSLSRSEYVKDPIGPRLFWMFATAEAVLQSTRFFVDRGRPPTSSTLGKIASFLPEPYAGYLRMLNRYSIIYSTVVSDALVIVFVLGAVAWWKGLTTA